MEFGNIKIEDAIEELIDYRGKTPPKSEAGIKLITAKVIKEGRILNGDHEYITEETYEDWMSRGIPQKGDVLITTEAPLGEIAQIRDSEKIALAQRVILLRANKEKISPNYLYQALKSPISQARLEARATGTTVLGISQKELRKVEIPYFDLSIQAKISSILSDFDDLIINNIRRIEILEEMARRIYREWFVHFRYPGHQEDELVASGTELGEIPEGWEVKKLEDLCELTLGQSPKSEFYNEKGEGLPFHQGVRDFGDRYPTTTTWCVKDKRIAEEGDILFSVRAPVGRINIANTKMIIGRGLHSIRSKFDNQVFIFHQLKDKFQEEDSIGSGTIYKSVTKKIMLNLKLIDPGEEMIEKFEEKVVPIFNQIKVLRDKNEKLKETRDLILPKLISGKVDIG